MQIDMESLGYAIGTVVGGLGTFGIWQRNNRVSNARASESVAAANAGIVKHEGQGEELKAVRERMDTIEAKYDLQKNAYDKLREELSEMKAMLFAFAVNVDNLDLCVMCKGGNKHLLDAIQIVLDSVLRHNRPKDEPQETLDVSAP